MTILQGAKLGALAGLVLSSIYAMVALLAFGAFIILTNIPSGKLLEALLGTWFISICAIPFAYLLGVLPGTIVGLVGGVMVGLLLTLLQRKISSAGAALSGLSVGVGMVILVHFLLWPDVFDFQAYTFAQYLLWLGVPSMIVPVALSWVGWKLQREQKSG